MPQFLLQVAYTADGAKGLVKDGGTKRRAAATSLTLTSSGAAQVVKKTGTYTAPGR